MNSEVGGEREGAAGDKFNVQAPPLFKEGYDLRETGRWERRLGVERQKQLRAEAGEQVLATGGERRGLL